MVRQPKSASWSFYNRIRRSIAIKTPPGIPPLKISDAPRHTETLLLSVMGLTPAILTETVWALAQLRKEIPKKVVVLTTMAGEKALIQRLFHEGGWQRLKETLDRQGIPVGDHLHFGTSSESIRLFPKADGAGDLQDLINAEDHRAAGDFILRVLRSYTEDSETRIIASLAGGRKTMAALLTSCMTLLARKSDHLCHVLVDRPYDDPHLQPLFLFPEPQVTHHLPGVKTAFRAEHAHIELVEVPFVRMRGLYQGKFRRLPPSFSALVEQVQLVANAKRVYPEIVVSVPSGILTVGGTRLQLSHSQFAFMSIIAGRLKTGRWWSGWHEVGEELDRLHSSSRRPSDPEWLQEFRARYFDPKESVRRWASALRRKLMMTFADPEMVNAILPDLKSGARPYYPRERVHIESL